MKKSTLAILPTGLRVPQLHHPQTVVLRCEYRSDRNPNLPYTAVVYRRGRQTLACTTDDKLCAALARAAIS